MVGGDPDRLRMMYGALPVRPDARVLLVHFGAEGQSLALPFAEERVVRFDLATLDLAILDLREPVAFPAAIAGQEAAHFDLIVVHGVLDHLPGRMRARRKLARQLLGRLTERLSTDGIIAWSGRNLFDQEKLQYNLRPFPALSAARPLGGLAWYRRAVRTLGLVNVNMVLIMPGFSDPQALISAAEPGARSYYSRLFTRYSRNYGIVKKLAARIILTFNLGPFLAPAFMVWGRKC